MSKTVITLVLFIFLMGAVGYFVLSGSEDEQPQTNSTAPTSNQTTEPNAQQPTQPVASNSIMTYSPEALANSAAENNLIFFHAAWCTVCNSVERSLNAGTIPEEINIFKVDYDSSTGQDLARQYNIPIQYTMVVVDPSGNELGKWVNQFNDGINEIRNNLAQI